MIAYIINNVVLNKNGFVNSSHPPTFAIPKIKSSLLKMELGRANNVEF